MKLISIAAPSGTGKTTFCQRLLRDFPELTLSISSTTRSPRGNEQNGREYYFLTPPQFKKNIQAGRFAEWAIVHGNYYGTSKDVIEKAFAEGKSVLLDIDVQGAASLKKTYPKKCFSVFLAPPSMTELEARLRARGTDSEETIQKRLKNAHTEMAESKHFDRIIVNDILERAYGELKALIQLQLEKPSPKV